MGTNSGCLLKTKKVTEYIAENYPNENESIVMANIELYLENKKKNLDAPLPTKEELNAFVESLHNKKNEEKIKPIQLTFKTVVPYYKVPENTNEFNLDSYKIDFYGNIFLREKEIQGIKLYLKTGSQIIQEFKDKNNVSEDSPELQSFIDELFDEYIKTNFNKLNSILDLINEDTIIVGNSRNEKFYQKITNYLSDQINRKKELKIKYDNKKYNFNQIEQSQLNKDFPNYKTQNFVSKVLANDFINNIEYEISEGNETLNNLLKKGPNKLFEEIKTIYANYVGADESEVIKFELSKINQYSNFKNWTEEQKLEKAKKVVSLKKELYPLTLRNFDILSDQAIFYIENRLGVKFKHNKILFKSSENIEGYEGLSNDNVKDEDNKNKENIYNVDIQTISNFDTLSQKVKHVIGTLPKYNIDGTIYLNQYNQHEYLDSTYIHSKLIEHLHKMDNIEDMIPLLEELKLQFPFINNLIQSLKNDNQLLSAFYQNYRKEFVEMQIMYKDKDGKYKTKILNKTDGKYSISNDWNQTIVSGYSLNETPLYDENGKKIEENAKKIEEKLNKFKDNFKFVKENQHGDNRVITFGSTGRDDEDKNILKNNYINVYKNPKVRKELEDILKSIGINTPFKLINRSIANSFKNTKINPLISLINNIDSIVVDRGHKQDKAEKNVFEDNKTYYRRIADILKLNSTDYLESSFHENGDNYNSYIVANYITKITKILKNTKGLSQEKVKEKIDKEFGQYTWYKKNGKYLNNWLNDLYRNKSLGVNLKAQDVFNHFKLLKFIGKQFNEFTDIDLQVALYQQYNSSPYKEVGIFNTPLMSDTNTLEFIRFYKLQFNETEDVFKQTAKAMTNLILQEYERINVVRNRDKMRLTGQFTEPINNMDIKRNNKGDIISMGGGEFTFIPELNRTTLYAEMTDAFKNNNNVNEIIERHLEKFLRKAEQDTVTYLDSINYFDVDSDTKSTLNDIDINGKRNYNFFNKNLLEAKKILENSWTSDMENYLSAFVTSNKISFAFNNNTKNNLTFNSIIDELENINDNPYVDTLIKNLLISANPNKAYREYWLNYIYAQSQIIQIYAVDNAFWGNKENFTKRFKSVHSPALRLNTQAEYNGEKIGTEIQKTIYLKDSIEPSNVLKDINEILDNKVENGSLTKIDKDFIISKWNRINVTDAQAFRPLSSYRKVMIMAGRWDDNGVGRNETAYQNLINGNWNIEDFNIIYQTIKPFTRTDVAKASHYGDYGDFKVPVMHKDSEFALLAIYSTISQSLSKNTKFKALQQFSDNYVDENGQKGIDLFVFESGVKLGLQGTIDINNLNSISDIINKLKNATYNNGVENKDVVHNINYNDYGIQVETKEHYFDNQQLIGSQFRRLNLLDIADDEIFNVNGKQLNKQEYVDLYNKVNIENIKEDYEKVNKEFSTKEKTSEILLTEIYNSDRYTTELKKAIFINENGDFTLPLYDPTFGIRTQEIIASAIRNRVAKQKMLGGTLIQVSDYGLTEDLKIVYENGKVKYMEAYMPASSKSLFKPLLDKKGQLDINKLPEELKTIIGYRVPTENSHSIIPIYIKGFLPVQNGSSIMLPKEITNITDGDFDVDKLFVLNRAFNLIEYNYKKARKDFEEYQAENKLITDILKIKNAEHFEDILDKDVSFKKWFNETKEKYKYDIPKIEVVEYDFNLPVEKNTRKQRDNLFLDLAIAQTRTNNSTFKMIKGGGFPDVIKMANVIKLLQLKDINYLEKITGEKNIKSIIAKIKQMSTDEVDKYVNDKLSNSSILTIDSYQKAFRQNMTGSKLIGIYAIHKANLTVYQYTNAEINPKLKFWINDKSYTKLNQIYDSNGNFISSTIAQFLASSTDNGKNPILGYLNQDEFTVNASMLLLRLGYSIDEVALLMQQDAIKYMQNLYYKDKYNFKIVEETIDHFKPKDFNYGYIIENNIKINSEMFIKEILGMNNDYDHNVNQYLISLMMYKVFKVSDFLNDSIKVTRQDSSSGQTKMIFQQLVDKSNIDDFNTSANLINIVTNETTGEEIQEDAAPILGLTNIISYNEENKDINEFDVPFIQAFQQYGKTKADEIFKKYFPFYNESINKILDSFKNLSSFSLNEQDINHIINHLFNYIMTKDSFLGGDKSLPLKEQILEFVKSFPEYYYNTLKNNQSLYENQLIKYINKQNDNFMPFTYLTFNKNYIVSREIEQNFINDWRNILYSTNSEERDLGMNLFKYFFYTSGLSYSPISPMNYAPNDLKQMLPDYLNILNDMLTHEDDYSNFYNQYLLNNLDNKKFVPVLKLNDIKFVENNKILDKVIISEDALKNVRSLYFCKMINNKPIYYRIGDNEDSDNIICERVYPAGIKNHLLNYDYNSIFVTPMFKNDDIEIDNTINDNNIKSDVTNIDNITSKDNITNPDDTTVDKNIINQLSQFNLGGLINEITNKNTNKEKEFDMDVEEDPDLIKYPNGKENGPNC
ncbi:MAG: hypothetical protein LBM96_05835 [Methanobrevibacter sp.]|jgi:hypothetical protein|nr:hypothetical protein [Candidatus Methanoflexus mossambicus]